MAVLLGQPEGAHGDQPRVAIRVARPEPPRKLVAVRTGHLDVNQRHLECLRTELLQRLVRPRCLHTLRALGAQVALDLGEVELWQIVPSSRNGVSGPSPQLFIHESRLIVFGGERVTHWVFLALSAGVLGVLYAVGANAKHGLRRTNADKRKAIGLVLADPEGGPHQWLEILGVFWSFHERSDQLNDHETAVLRRAAVFTGRVNLAHMYDGPHSRSPEQFTNSLAAGILRKNGL